MSEGPGYWMWEASGVLRPAVERYLRREPLTAADIAALRAYLRQWICAPVWDDNPHATADDREQIADLRERIDTLTTRDAIHGWLADAFEFGIDPL